MYDPLWVAIADYISELLRVNLVFGLLYPRLVYRKISPSFFKYDWCLPIKLDHLTISFEHLHFTGTGSFLVLNEGKADILLAFVSPKIQILFGLSFFYFRFLTFVI